MPASCGFWGRFFLPMWADATTFCATGLRLVREREKEKEVWMCWEGQASARVCRAGGFLPPPEA